eukprot:NODE_593_length_5604_cov_0.739691.p7 type:complete len:182 gc:universal NODE_593_length_5604_cov_0.739691:1952-2497(+)
MDFTWACKGCKRRRSWRIVQRILTKSFAAWTWWWYFVDSVCDNVRRFAPLRLINCSSVLQIMRILNPYNQVNSKKLNTEYINSTESKLPTANYEDTKAEVQKVITTIEKATNQKKSTKKAGKPSGKSFDHLHSQALIDEVRDLRKRLNPRNAEIPTEFLDYLKCLDMGNSCKKELEAILSK